MAQVDEIVTLVRRVLGDDVIGAYLHGSAVLGELRPRSDTDAAADWALARLPEEHRPVLARARGVYLGEEDERWDDLRPRLRPHADFVVQEIERAVSGGRKPALDEAPMAARGALAESSPANQQDGILAA